MAGLHGDRAFKRAEARQYQQIFHTEYVGVSPKGLALSMTRMEDDFLLAGTGLTRTEAAVGFTKAVIRAFGQEVVQPDEFFANHPGIRYVEAGVGIASNPLTYAPFFAGALSSAAATERTFAVGDPLIDAYRGVRTAPAPSSAAVRAYEVGIADALRVRSVVGDAIDIHHVGQARPFE